MTNTTQTITVQEYNEALALLLDSGLDAIDRIESADPDNPDHRKQAREKLWAKFEELYKD